MQYTLNTVENKTPEWKILSITGLDGMSYQDVSVNLKDKEGKEQWPNWAEFIEGAKIEGNAWKSATNKMFLFPSREKKATNGGGAGVKAAQERKGEMIEKAQENKQSGIMVAAAMRDATLLTLASLKDQPFPTDDEYKAEFIKWRTWYMQQWRDTEKAADVPFN